jgi:hypothetical protein
VIAPKKVVSTAFMNLLWVSHAINGRALGLLEQELIFGLGHGLVKMFGSNTVVFSSRCHVVFDPLSDGMLILRKRSLVTCVAYIFGSVTNAPFHFSNMIKWIAYFARGGDMLINSVPNQTSNDRKHGVSPNIATEGCRKLQ